MSDSINSDPLDIENMFNLLPERYQTCAFAEFVIATCIAFGGAAGSPLEIISGIQEDCPGYDEETGRAPGESFELVDTPMGSAFTTQYSEFTNCPLASSDEL